MKHYDKIFIPVSGLYKAPFLVVDSKTEYAVNKAEERSHVIVFTIEEIKELWKEAERRERWKWEKAEFATPGLESPHTFATYLQSKGIQL